MLKIQLKRFHIQDPANVLFAFQKSNPLLCRDSKLCCRGLAFELGLKIERGSTERSSKPENALP